MFTLGVPIRRTVLLLLALSIGPAEPLISFPGSTQYWLGTLFTFSSWLCVRPIALSDWNYAPLNQPEGGIVDHQCRNLQDELLGLIESQLTSERLLLRGLLGAAPFSSSLISYWIHIFLPLKKLARRSRAYKFYLLIIQKTQVASGEKL
jgi:hypothetical protein